MSLSGPSLVLSMNEYMLKKRIYYHDTDLGGVVYYANYLKYFEEVRTEHLRSLGIDLKELHKEDVVFAVAKVSIRYRSPARYSDELVISSKIDRVKGASIEFSHIVKRAESLLVESATTLVTIGPDF